MQWRRVVAGFLIWVAWALILTALIAATALHVAFATASVVFVAIAIILVALARRLAPDKWYRYLTIAAGLYGALSFLRAAADRNNATEHIVNAMFFVVCCAGLEIGRRIKG